MKRIKALPWLAILAVGKVVIDYWLSVSKKDRKKAIQTLKDSKGIPSRMTPAQKRHLVHVAKQMRPTHLAYDAARTASPFPMPDITGGKQTQRNLKK